MQSLQGSSSLLGVVSHSSQMAIEPGVFGSASSLSLDVSGSELTNKSLQEIGLMRQLQQSAKPIHPSVIPVSTTTRMPSHNKVEDPLDGDDTDDGGRNDDDMGFSRTLGRGADFSQSSADGPDSQRSARRKGHIQDFCMKLHRYQNSHVQSAADLQDLEDKSRVLFVYDKYEQTTKGDLEIFCVCCQKTSMTSDKKPLGLKPPPNLVFPNNEKGNLCSFCAVRATTQFARQGVYRCHRKSVADYIVNPKKLVTTIAESGGKKGRDEFFDGAEPEIFVPTVAKGERRKMKIKEFGERVVRMQAYGPDPATLRELNATAKTLFSQDKEDMYKQKDGTEMYCACCRKVTTSPKRCPTGYVSLPFNIKIPNDTGDNRVCYFCYKRSHKQFSAVGIFRCHRNCVSEYVVNRELLNIPDPQIPTLIASAPSTQVVEAVPGAVSAKSVKRRKQIRFFAEKLVEVQRSSAPSPAAVAELERVAKILWTLDKSDAYRPKDAVEMFCACCQKTAFTAKLKPKGHKSLPFSIRFPAPEGARYCPTCYSRAHKQFSFDGIFRCHRTKVTDYVVNDALLKRKEGEMDEPDRDGEESGDDENYEDEDMGDAGDPSGLSSNNSKLEKRKRQIQSFGEKLIRLQRSAIRDTETIAELKRTAQSLWSQEKPDPYKPKEGTGVEMYCVCCQKVTLTSKVQPTGYASLPFGITFAGSDLGRVCFSCYSRAHKQFSVDGVFRCHRNCVTEYVVNLRKFAPDGEDIRMEGEECDPLNPANGLKNERRRLQIRDFAEKLARVQRGESSDPMEIVDLERDAKALWTKDKSDLFRKKDGVEMFCVCCQKLSLSCKEKPKGYLTLPFGIRFPGDDGRKCSSCYNRAFNQFTLDGVFRCHRLNVNEFVLNPDVLWPKSILKPLAKKKVVRLDQQVVTTPPSSTIQSSGGGSGGEGWQEVHLPQSQRVQPLGQLPVSNLLVSGVTGLNSESRSDATMSSETSISATYSSADFASSVYEQSVLLAECAMDETSTKRKAPEQEATRSGDEVTHALAGVDLPHSYRRSRARVLDVAMDE